ncbi:hypothetical protein GO499_02395 [Algicella marina]|uniref:Uncharacterized protein n=1 Tax=Algicella marina TaxID=2683284 RepID=A0A6P1STV0_9RHOB|nr:hypothetical protein GO499_02395 [Algicella marina]
MTREKKLLEKQKAGKVDSPPETFISALKMHS